MCTTNNLTTPAPTAATTATAVTKNSTLTTTASSSTTKPIPFITTASRIRATTTALLGPTTSDSSNNKNKTTATTTTSTASTHTRRTPSFRHCYYYDGLVERHCEYHYGGYYHPRERPPPPSLSLSSQSLFMLATKEGDVSTLFLLLHVMTPIITRTTLPNRLSDTNTKYMYWNTLLHQRDFVAGRTPLHYACYYQHYDVVKFLLESEHEMLVECSSSKYHDAERLYDRNNNNNIYLLSSSVSSSSSRSSTTEVLVLCSNLQDRYSEETPFHVACQQGDIEIVKLLLEHSVSTILLSVVVNNNSTMKTKKKKKKSDVQQLVPTRLDILVELLQQRNKSGRTPFHSAVHTKQYHVVKYLIELLLEDCYGYYYGGTMIDDDNVVVDKNGEYQPEQQQRIGMLSKIITTILNSRDTYNETPLYTSLITASTTLLLLSKTKATKNNNNITNNNRSVLIEMVELLLSCIKFSITKLEQLKKQVVDVVEEEHDREDEKKNETNDTTTTTTTTDTLSLCNFRQSLYHEKSTLHKKCIVEYVMNKNRDQITMSQQLTAIKELLKKFLGIGGEN